MNDVPTELERRAVELGCRTELQIGASGNFMLHAWTGQRCVVIEHRGDEWGVTPDLAQDDPGFDSGHPLVFHSAEPATARFLSELAG